MTLSPTIGVPFSSSSCCSTRSESARSVPVKVPFSDFSSPARLREIVEYGALPGGLGWYRAIPLTGRQTRAMWEQKVDVPVTHVWSSGDTALSRSTAELTERWTTGPFELVVLDGATHWLPEQSPDVLAEIVLGRLLEPVYSEPPTSRPSAS